MKRKDFIFMAIFYVFLFLSVPFLFGAGEKESEEAIAPEELVVGTRYEPSIDPHFLYLSHNAAYAREIFDGLTDRDSTARVIPNLATSWKMLDDTTWEFKIRAGVKFHDGSVFTPEDFAYSVERIPKVPNNPSSYTMNVQMIDKVEIKDPQTIIIKTKYSYPLLPHRLTDVFIVSKKLVENATTKDFVSGKVAIGTGPYKFYEYIPGDQYTIVRNEDYWGEKPYYNKVTFKIIPDNASRVAALLGGDVDIIDDLPPTDVPVLEEKGFQVLKRPSSRTLFLAIDSARDQSPYVTGKDGNPLPGNPLKDTRVRKAISMAIDRDTIIEQVMDGLAEKANQIIPKGWYSYAGDIKDIPYDPDRAKELLAEAGYPDGFGLTIHGPNDRYVNDEKVCQAIGQMLSRIGLDVKVETMPKSIYFGKFNTSEFSLAMLGWESSMLGSSLMVFKSAFHTYNKDQGVGLWNAGRYSNSKFDELVKKASASRDDKEREQLLIAAMKVLIEEDMGVIPLYTQFSLFGATKDIDYKLRADGHFYAAKVKPVTSK